MRFLWAFVLLLILACPASAAQWDSYPNAVPDAADEFGYWDVSAGAFRNATRASLETILSPVGHGHDNYQPIGDYLTEESDPGVATHESAYDHGALPTADQKAAMDGANAPSGTNAFATVADIVAGGGGEVSSVNGMTGAVTIDADDIGDGATKIIPTATQESNWDTAFSWGNHAGIYEPVLGTPAGDAYLLKSTSLGVRSWGLLDWGEVQGKPSTFTPSAHAAAHAAAGGDPITITENQISDLSHTVNTDSQTLSFTLPTLAISGGNSVDLSGLQDGTGTDDQTAAEVPIIDTGTYFTGADVEAALQEIGPTMTDSRTPTSHGNEAHSETYLTEESDPAFTASEAANFTTGDKLKLDGIAAGAEVNVNADWNAASGDAQILNKPALGTAAAKDTGTAIGNVVEMQDVLGVAKLPAVDGSQLTNLPTGASTWTDLVNTGTVPAGFADGVDNTDNNPDRVTASAALVTYDAAGLNSWIPSVGSDNKTLIVDDKTTDLLIDDDVTFPSNIQVEVLAGAKFAHSGETTVIPGDPEVVHSYDTFTDTGELSVHTPDTGTGWTEHLGDWEISNNTVVLSSGDASAINLASVDAGFADATIEASLITPASGDFSPSVAFNIVDSDNYWMFMVSSIDGVDKYGILRYVSGSGTWMAEETTTLSTSTTYAAKVVTSGDSVSCYIDGAPVLSYSGASREHQTATRHGIRAGTRDVSVTAWDDFKVYTPEVPSTTETADILTFDGPFVAGQSSTVFSGFYADTVQFGAEVRDIFFQWFGPSGDGVTDDADEWETCLHSATGHQSIYWPREGTFHIGERVTRRIDFSGLGIYFRGSKIGTGNNAFMGVFAKELGSHTGLSISVTEGATKFTIPAGVTVEKGNTIQLWDTSASWVSGATYYHGVFAKVVEVDGTTAHIDIPAAADFTGTDLTVWAGVDGVIVDGVEIDMTAVTGVNSFGGVSLAYMTNAVIQNVTATGSDDAGYAVAINSNNGVIRNIRASGFLNKSGDEFGGRIGYGIQLSGNNVKAERTITRNCKHHITSGARTYHAANVVFEDCIIYNDPARASDGSLFKGPLDFHANNLDGTFNRIFADVPDDAVVQMRNKRLRLTNSTIIHRNGGPSSHPLIYQFEATPEFLLIQGNVIKSESAQSLTDATTIGVARGSGNSFTNITQSGYDLTGGEIKADSGPWDYSDFFAINAPSIPTGSCYDISKSITGVALGDLALAGTSVALPNGVFLTAWAGNGSIKAQLCNMSGADYDPPYALYTLRAIKQ